jgi:hypothetical protein
MEEEWQITLLNDCSMTHISEGHASESVLHPTFVDSRSVLNYTWAVWNENWGNDHFPIRIKKYTKLDTTESNRRKTQRLHNKHTNWVSFTESMKREIGRWQVEQKEQLC